uniref:Uncharacterized protein n=1 Tax=Opuntia streptacantha TaxID=393608 RepID=A0A7C8Z9M8_OPUST
MKPIIKVHITWWGFSTHIPCGNKNTMILDIYNPRMLKIFSAAANSISVHAKFLCFGFLDITWLPLRETGSPLDITSCICKFIGRILWSLALDIEPFLDQRF